jgi:hypothetical protein
MAQDYSAVPSVLSFRVFGVEPSMRFDWSIL